MRQHEEAIARYVERVARDPDVLAVVITGSVARGTERADSDVDLYLVVTEERWDSAFEAHRLMYVEREGAGYEHGYFDIKLATLSYLDDAAERGDDPVRDSFAASRIAFSRIDDLDARLALIASLPDEIWDRRAGSFVAQARLHGGYFLRQGIERGDVLLTANAAVHLVLAVGRALLAHNRVLYQGPKYLDAAVSSLPVKPPGVEAALRDVVSRPTIESGAALLDLLEGFRDWPVPAESTLSRFVLDSELAWRYRTPPPEYS
ncbi:nucleotidyltransferase domain-containing protein [Planctomonas psychrotolerans]|uniref:nucleotidyltransferase domain-containing protein n=1 Tax=Planctomonas psychrotolerans TaxID=2528712 RepID=UPI00123A6B3F|nr:nucleotidyltransferase domain-containing protein [Planctomonas psychrotolerans]